MNDAHSSGKELHFTSASSPCRQCICWLRTWLQWHRLHVHRASLPIYGWVNKSFILHLIEVCLWSSLYLTKCRQNWRQVSYIWSCPLTTNQAVSHCFECLVKCSVQGHGSGKRLVWMEIRMHQESGRGCGDRAWGRTSFVLLTASKEACSRGLVGD